MSARAARGWTSAAANAVTVTAATRPAWVVRRLDGDGHLAITDGLLAITALVGPTPRETYRRRKDYSKGLESIGKDFQNHAKDDEVLVGQLPGTEVPRLAARVVNGFDEARLHPVLKR